MGALTNEAPNQQPAAATAHTPETISVENATVQMPDILNAYFEVRSTNSSNDHTRSVTFAAIAGVTRKVLCSRTRL